MTKPKKKKYSKFSNCDKKEKMKRKNPDDLVLKPGQSDSGKLQRTMRETSFATKLEDLRARFQGNPNWGNLSFVPLASAATESLSDAQLSKRNLNY